MKNQNRIYILFITLTLLFFNPLTYYLVYKTTEVYTSRYIKLAIWIIFILGLFSIFLIGKNRFSRKVKNLIFSITFAGFLFSIFVALDGLISLFTSTGAVRNNGLIFEPFSSAKYHTVEFESSVNINSLGLRGREIKLKKEADFRILCFGDSWTFGWGVNNEDTWPNSLETYLNRSGIGKVEVINCGQPGQCTSDYKLHMAKIVPQLKPDIVIVGVLQLEDLAQLYVNYFLKTDALDFTKHNRESIYNRIKGASILFLKVSFKNIINLFTKPGDGTKEISSQWESKIKTLIDKFSFWQSVSFSSLSDTVRTLFKSGNLNPSLIEDFINFPNSDLILNDPKQPATIYAIDEMRKDLLEMKEICLKYNSRLIFINLPEAQFTGHQVVMTPADKYLCSYLYNYNKIDSIYSALAAEIGIPYFEMTDRFKNLSDKNSYFFRFDGHPTPKGQKEIATAVGEFMSKEIHYFKINIKGNNKN